MCVMNCMMGNQMPMSWARSTTGRRYSVTNFWASKRISTQLLTRAKRGARGQAATKMVMKPNWITDENKEDVQKSLQQLNHIYIKHVTELSSQPTSHHTTRVLAVFIPLVQQHRNINPTRLTHFQVFAEESLTDQQLIVCLPRRNLLLCLPLHLPLSLFPFLFLHLLQPRTYLPLPPPGLQLPAK